ECRLNAMTPVPALRLVWYTIFVAVVAALAGPLMALRPAALLVAAGFVVMALADLALSFWRAAPVRASMPPLVRLTKDRPGVVPVTLSNESGRASSVRFGLGLPAGIEMEEVDRAVDLPGGAKHSRIELACTPRR